MGREANLQRNDGIVAMWRQGFERGVIARQFGVTPNTVMGVVYRWQQRTGLGRRRLDSGRRWSDDEIHSAFRLLRMGMTWRETADKLGVNVDNLKRACYRYRRRHS